MFLLYKSKSIDFFNLRKTAQRDTNITAKFVHLEYTYLLKVVELITALWSFVNYSFIVCRILFKRHIVKLEKKNQQLLLKKVSSMRDLF